MKNIWKYATFILICYSALLMTDIVKFKDLYHNSQNEIVELKEKHEELLYQYRLLNSQQPMVVNHVKTVETIGEFEITHYCGCDTCNGIWGNITAIGTIPQIQHTIAVDPNVIPLGSKVIIEGIEYVAEDTGSLIIGNKIDLYVSSHEEAKLKGIKKVTVYKEV